MLLQFSRRRAPLLENRPLSLLPARASLDCQPTSQPLALLRGQGRWCGGCGLTRSLQQQWERARGSHNAAVTNNVAGRRRQCPTRSRLANDSLSPAPHTAARMPEPSLRETTPADWSANRRRMPSQELGAARINSSTRQPCVTFKRANSQASYRTRILQWLC